MEIGDGGDLQLIGGSNFATEPNFFIHLIVVQAKETGTHGDLEVVRFSGGSVEEKILMTGVHYSWYNSRWLVLEEQKISKMNTAGNDGW